MEHTTLKDALTLKLKWVHTSKVLQMNKLIAVIKTDTHIIYAKMYPIG